ncbi:MAG: hypothetical protein MUD05_07755 [Candidatus Nanopelagicales bacterium]|jgi:hypothetical protein|nr:hypothetical protein [Candidatus Nanopelagicales bacterium]
MKKIVSLAMLSIATTLYAGPRVEVRPHDDAAVVIDVPADGRLHTWQRWDYAAEEPYRWGAASLDRNGNWQSWDYSKGTYRWGRVDVD